MTVTLTLDKGFIDPLARIVRTTIHGSVLFDWPSHYVRRIHELEKENEHIRRLATEAMTLLQAHQKDQVG